MAFNKAYGDCTGPFGFPMYEEDARDLDSFLKEHSKDDAVGYKKITNEKSLEYFIKGERADVSVVTAGTIDLDNEIVSPKGVDWSAFEKRRNVTLNHNYWAPPIGKALWWKQVNNVWKAKTVYAERPKSLPEDKEWMPDTIFDLIQQSLLPGKSIGFIPVKWHEPTRDEISKDYSLKSVNLIFDEVKVYEYAVAYIQSNTDSIVEAVAGKSYFKDEYLSNIFEPVVKKLNEIKKPNNNPPNPEPQEKICVTGISAEEYVARRKGIINGRMIKLKDSLEDIVNESLNKFSGRV